LTVGTEVTSGQITNTNAAWLSQQLSDLNIPVAAHLSVPDEHRQIIDSLNFISQRASLIFVTGGLGPTRDDLTREAVTEWLGSSLVFDQDSWDEIVRRLTQYGIDPAVTNRQQCYFPKEARILANAVGTANAFQVDRDPICLWCLPGPPREIKRIWQDHLATELQSKVPAEAGLKLFRWQCLGHSESSLGELVESLIAESDLVSGYRPHLPYVEIKIWSPIASLSQNQLILDRLEQALKPWLVTRDDEDIASLCWAELQPFAHVRLLDHASDGILAERLGFARRRAELPHDVWLINQLGLPADTGDQPVPEDKAADTLRITIGSLHESGEWEISLRWRQKRLSTMLKIPYKTIRGRLERSKRYLAEKTLHYLTQNLPQLSQDNS
jgi:molybdenum cofactor synthesis domain-containing protein